MRGQAGPGGGGSDWLFNARATPRERIVYVDRTPRRDDFWIVVAVVIFVVGAVTLTVGFLYGVYWLVRVALFVMQGGC